ncbi:hypothetical protein ACKWTF_016224 [Chironomus riparius]
MSDYNTEAVTHNDGDILSYGVKITFIVMEVIIAILAVTGNLAVIIAFITLTVCIAHLSSAINPMLYAYHMRDIRHAIFRLFRSDVSENLTSVRKSSVMRSESNARSLRVVSLSIVDK